MDNIHTLLTANGSLYAAENGEFDLFITPALPDIEHVAAAFNWTPEFAWENAMHNVLDMRAFPIARMSICVSDLENGNSLTGTDASTLDHMHSFLRSAVGSHQRTFGLLHDDTLERWIQELGLREGVFANDDAYNIVHESALWFAVHVPCLEIKFPGNDMFAEDRLIKPTRQQNILAGRYLRSLGLVGKLFGSDPVTPEEILAEWAPKNCEYIKSRPSLRDQVASALGARGFEVKRNVQL